MQKTHEFPISAFIVERDEKNGGNLKFSTYEKLENAFAQNELHPADLKSATGCYINRLLEPIRKIFEDPGLKKLAADAYPKKKESKLISIFIQENS